MTRQEEVDFNYAVFLELLSEIATAHEGEFALMKSGQILDFFASAEDARRFAEARIKDGLYSIQPVSREAIYLGSFTHAVPVG